MPSLVNRLLNLQKRQNTIIESRSNLPYGNQIEIHQYQDLRWIYTGGLSVQAVINLNDPNRLVLTYQSQMLIIPLLCQTPQKILNLGYGGGGFERFFTSHPSQTCRTYIVSVEASATQIALTQRYMKMPRQNWPVKHTTAESFLETKKRLQDQAKFDLILIDLFIGQQHAKSLYQRDFYQKISNNLNLSGIVSINLAPKNDRDMCQLLNTARHYFPYGKLGQVSNCGNIVMNLSKSPLPESAKLATRIRSSFKLWRLDFASNLPDFVDFGP